MKEPKKERKKAGWSEKDRHCALCKQYIAADKALMRHHLCYDPEVIVSLHFACHELVHSRCKYNNPYQKKYGKDFGALALAMDIARMYSVVKDKAVYKFPNIMEGL